MVGVIGKSGSGKTTLINIILGLINESEFNSGSNNNTSSREDHIMEKVLAIVKTYNLRVHMIYFISYIYLQLVFL